MSRIRDQAKVNLPRGVKLVKTEGKEAAQLPHGCCANLAASQLRNLESSLR